MKFIYSVLILFCCSNISYCQNVSIEGMIQCERGNFALDASNYSDALKIYEDCIKNYDSLSSALFGAARANYLMGNYSKSKKNIYAYLRKADKNSADYKNALRLAATIDDTENSKFEMVLVKGGIFTMGCKEGIDVDCEDEERPSHQVEVKDFYIGKYEVTQAQWKNIMGTNPSFFTGCDDCPVEQVSWDDAQNFINKLNKKYPSMQFRLPQEAEWEYAARGGKETKNFKYSGSDSADDVSWFDKNSGGKTHAVGQKQPNELGLYDMGGNVWEWCSDWFFFYTGTNTEINRGVLAKSHHTDRGGCWQYTSKYSAPGTRGGLSHEEKNNDLGFRLARSVN